MKKVSLFLAICAASSIQAFAATDGTLGASSNGSANVTLTVPKLVRVSFPNADIDLGTYTPGSGKNVTETFCIYSNQGAGSVNINVTVDPQNTPGAGTQPVLKSGAFDIPYTLNFNLAAGASVSSNIQVAGVTVNNHSSANTTSPTCSAGASNSHEFNVVVADAAMSAVPAGSYSDTIDVTVAAN